MFLDLFLILTVAVSHSPIVNNLGGYFPLYVLGHIFVIPLYFVYQIGKETHFESLKDWFKSLYEILLGQSHGPRLGSFITLYGVEKTINLIDRAINGDLK